MYYCHKCKRIFDGLPLRAIIIEEEREGIKYSTKLSVCPDCLKEVSLQFMNTAQPETPKEEND